MPEVELDEIARFAVAALTGAGVPGDDAAIVAESIVHAHAHGKHTHGLGRLPIYLRKLRQGLMRADTPLDEIAAAPALALLDAGHGFGQVAGARGMERAVAMARACGIGAVGIRHSNNFGTAAFVAERAVAAGMAGLVFSNAAPAIAPTGGHRAVFGTNPLALAVPGPDGAPPIVLDMATAQVARGKIRLAATNGESIPLGWALDARGQPTQDAAAALKGSMVALGGAKGYGLSLMIDVLAGLLTGSASGGRALPLDHPDRVSDCGHLLIALDIARFLPPDEYAARIDELVAATRAAGPEGAVWLPGERSGRYMQGRAGRVPLSAAVLAKLDATAAQIGLAPLRRSDPAAEPEPVAEPPVALVLGGTSAHGVLLDKLAARGWRTVLVDWLEHPPARDRAHEHSRVSTLDVEGVTALARERDARLVIATNVDQAYVAACEVAERLGLPRPYSAATGRLIADKTQVKAAMAAAGLPTPRHVVLRAGQDPAPAMALAGLDFPVIVKPADTTGSKGVALCRTPADLAPRLARAISLSRSGSALVEAYVDGVEYNIYAVISDGQPRPITACRKYNLPGTDGTAITAFATWYQRQLPDGVQAQVVDILKGISQGFGLGDTAIILQVIVRGTEVHVLEFAPRVGGGLSTWAVQQQTGYDLVEAQLSAWLGQPPALPGPPGETEVITVHLYARPCVFDRIEGVEALLAEGTIVDYIPNKTRGATITADRASRDRVGSFVLEGRDQAQILERVARLIDRIAVYDSDGRQVADKDTYLRAV